MPTTNGKPPDLSAKQQPKDLATLREQLELITVERQLAEQTAQKRLLESFIGGGWDYFGGSDLWDRVRPRQNDDAGPFGWLPLSVPSDRRHGANWPLWRTIIELDMLRQESRVRCQSNAYARGLLRNLVNNVIGKGFAYKVDALVKPRPGEELAPEAKALIDRTQKIVDRFLASNNWNGQVDPRRMTTVAGTRERECFLRVKGTDGEAFLRFHFLEDGQTKVRFIEPEQIRDNLTDPQEGWSYGIQHQMEPFEDVETILNYSVFWPDPSATGGEGERDLDQGVLYEIIPADEVLHLKGPDTPSNVKRGTSDFLYSAGASLDRAERLTRNASLGASYRAATGEIWQHTTSTQTQVQSLADALATYSRPDPTTGSNIEYERLIAPAIRRIPGGQEMVPQPADNTPNYLEGATGDLRQAAASQCVPDYMVSGDASNGNYSSLETASSPAVRAGQTEQEYYKAAYMLCVWKAVTWAAECGQLPINICDLVEIQVEAPSVLHRNELEDAQTKQIEAQAGILSPQTWAAKTGLDYEQELANIEQHQARVGPPASDLGLPEEDAGPENKQTEAWNTLQKQIMGRMKESRHPPGTTVVHYPAAGPAPGVELLE